jgi:hypothetical protein
MRKYNSTLLNEILLRDSAIIINNYNKLSRDTSIDFICKCGKHYQKNFRYLVENGGAHCKDCTQINKLEKAKETLIKNFGVDNPLKSEEIKNKIKNTCLQKYKCTHPSQNLNVKEKKKNTFLKKYGYSTSLLSPDIKAKICNTLIKNFGVDNPFKSKIIQNKYVKSMQQKYGVTNPLKLEAVKQKIKDTSIKKYGHSHSSQSYDVKLKSINTCNIKYGYNYILQIPEIRNKIQNTNLKRYGVRNPSQNPIIQWKVQESGFKYKRYIMPSGNCRFIQGYEHFALDELVTKYNEDDIITSKKEIPTIPYIYNNSKHVYFPDIYIKSENKIIEVKSDYTYEKEIEKNIIKKTNCINRNFKFEFWIYNKYKNKKII